MTITEAPAEIRPISHQSTNDRVFALVTPLLRPGARLVDVGAGEGYFTKKVGDFVEQSRGSSPSDVVAACDLYPQFFRYPRVTCDPINADGTLPYPDRAFDVACSLEVVEHVEDQFLFARELYRVVRPGGVVIVSTPNVLNINSRLRTLHSGFAVLFDPLPLRSHDPVHTSGHIHPVSYYYLAYALHRAGFTEVRVEFDRFKSSAKALLALCSPFVYAGNALFRSRVRRRRADASSENESILNAMNSRQMLTARSVIAIGKKGLGSRD